MYFKEHLSQVSAVSSDGNLMASGSVDTKLKLWDIRRKQSIFTLKNHSMPVSCIKLTPLCIVTGSLGDAYISVTEINSQKSTMQLRDGNAKTTTVDVLPEKKIVVSAHSDRRLRLWDLNAGKLISTCPKESTPAQKVLFHPSSYQSSSSNLNVVAGYSDSIKCLEVKQGAINDIYMKS